MRVVILCGGRGTRILEETKRIPKPMVRIGRKPIICHIMNIYNKFGFKDFILAAGYKKEILKKYFKSKRKYGNVTVIDTGQETMTGGRILRLKPYLKKVSYIKSPIGIFLYFKLIKSFLFRILLNITLDVSKFFFLILKLFDFNV